MPKLAEPAEKPNDSTIGERVSSPNPYREIVRRRFAEPILLLLVFVLGVWLWDNHLGEPAPYGPDAWELALRKADRDLRIAESSTHLPGWLRPALGIDSLEQTISTAVDSLEEIYREGHGPPGVASEGAYALAVLTAVRAKGNPAIGPFRQLGLDGPPPPRAILSRMIDGRESWWDLAYLRGLDSPEVEFAAKLVDSRSRYLANNAVKARGMVLAITLGGLVFLPGTILAFIRGSRQPLRERATHWKLSFGLGVFLVAYLASLGFGTAYEQSLRVIAERLPADQPGTPLLSMPLYIGIDSLTRFLPPMIALAFLFRRPIHAISRLGLAGPLDGRMVLGAFSLLQIVDFGLRMTLDTPGTPDPLGGLSSIEKGAWGLVFAIASACIAAPIAEEILYRGVLFRTLAARLRLPAAVIVSSAIFSLVHFYQLSSLLIVGAVGAVCAMCYLSSRTLLTAIVLHALYNAAIKIPEWIVYHAPLS